MQLTELIDTAFRRGCNSSLAAIEKTDRFGAPHWFAQVVKRAVVSGYCARAR